MLGYSFPIGREGVYSVLSMQAIKDEVSIDDLVTYYQTIRNQSERLCSVLEIEDFGIQTEAFVSPPKWHLAHTAWFFETLILKSHVDSYLTPNPLYASLFNSYYDTIGGYHPRPQRGLLSRPTVKEVYAYRAHVDEAMRQLLLDVSHPQREELVKLTILGLNHEQQHQELLLTDIKHILAYNPLRPVYRELDIPEGIEAPKLEWCEFEGGIQAVGFSGQGFAYDNETPLHKVYLNDFRLASRPVTNGEYIEFIEAGGYKESDHWLSDAWKTIRQDRWGAPLYWEKRDEQWWTMTLAGMRPVDYSHPVCHVSYYEAAAYARWVGKRLPTEQEWEIATAILSVEGNFVNNDILHPVVSEQTTGSLLQMFGDVWEWTQSPYVSYPGYKQAIGALGEYNGKFMSSQMVLRGGSCATPLDHIRPSYRNFFYPQERWQFSGFRLAEDA